MQSVEQYAGEKTAAFREYQGKYHSVDQGEADLKDRLPKVRAACLAGVPSPETSLPRYPNREGAMIR